MNPQTRIKTEIATLRTRAMNDDTEAMNLLYEILHTCPMFEVKKNEAYQWCKTAAELNHPQALLNLGFIHFAAGKYPLAEALFLRANQRHAFGSQTALHVVRARIMEEYANEPTEVFAIPSYSRDECTEFLLEEVA